MMAFAENIAIGTGRLTVDDWLPLLLVLSRWKQLVLQLLLSLPVLRFRCLFFSRSEWYVFFIMIDSDEK